MKQKAIISDSLIVLMALVVICINSANAGVIAANYDAGPAGGGPADLNPTLQGWSLSAGTGANSTGLKPDGTTGLNGWAITDNSTGITDSYNKLVSAADIAAASANGFTLSTTMRIDPSVVGTDAMMMQYNNGTDRWLIFIDTETDGQYSVLTFGTGTPGGTVMTGVYEDGLYHSFVIVNSTGAAGANSAELRVDGIKKADIGTISAGGGLGVVFGSGSSSGKSKGIYNSVTLDVVTGTTAGLVSPANGVGGVSVTADVQWSAPSGYTPTGYDVYFGTNPTATLNPKEVDNALQASYDPTGDLAWSTMYYWQVDTYDGGTKHPGQPWSFTTRAENLIKVACCGDSITYGSGISDPASNSYPAQLQVLLGSGYDVQNFGRSGARVTQSSSNPYKGSTQYNDAIAFEPDIVFIALGINDCSVSQWAANKPHFVTDYKDLISDFQALSTNPAIYIGTLMPVMSPYEPLLAIHDTMAECTPLIEQVASDEGLPLIDLYTRLNMEASYYAADGLHPSVEGATLITEKVKPAITGDYGGLQMPWVFADHMVLQRNEPIPVFGTADVGESISVSLGGNVQNTVADADGRWRVDMPAMTAGGGSYTLTVTGNTTLIFTDVLIGEVWFCAGQSNMEWRCSQSSEWGTESALADNYPDLRLLNREPGIPYSGGGAVSLANIAKINVDEYYTGTWQVCSSTTAAPISAVGYYFARDVHVATGVPVGLIDCARGGVPMEAFTPREALRQEVLYGMMNNWIRNPEALGTARAMDNLINWYNLDPAPGAEPHHPFEPTFLYYADVADVIPYAIQGAVWYQGETNATIETDPLDEMDRNSLAFAALINGWRNNWGQGDFPFYYVQLPNLNRNWMEFRDMQLKTLDALPNVGMAVTIDLGNPTNVHPTNKLEVGHRLSLWARANEYGEPSLVHSGPLYNGTFTDEGATLRVGFDHVGGGLEAFGGGALTAFEISDVYGNWYSATATIDGGEIVVSSGSVADAKAARYAWAPNPDTSGRLINAEGLPASPFRAGDFTVDPDPCVVYEEDFQDYDEENPTDFSIDTVATGNWASSNTAFDATRIFTTGNFGGTKLWISKTDGTSITSDGIDIMENTDYIFSTMLVCETSSSTTTGQASYDLRIGPDAGSTTSLIGGAVTVDTHGDDWDIANSKEDHIFTQAFNTGNLNPGDKLFIVMTRISSSAWIGADDVTIRRSQNSPDIDRDGDVDLGDFARFAQQWLNAGCEGCNGADLSLGCDGNVTIDDFLILAENWLSPINLVSQWSFDDASGTTLTDDFGANNGTLMNMDDFDWVAGHSGTALDFDGIDDHVEVTGNAALNPNTDSWSTSFWLQSGTASQGTQIISKRADAAPFAQCSIGLSSGDSYSWAPGSKITFLFREDTGIEKGGYTTSDIDFSDWTHVCVVLDRTAGTVYVYIEGVSVPVTLDHDDALPTINNTDPLYIGGNPNALNLFQGLIDEVGIYDTALDSNEIQQLAGW